jgi:hypothetical protein
MNDHPIMISVPVLGTVRHDFAKVARSVVEAAGLQFVGTKGENTRVLTVIARAASESQMKTIDTTQIVTRLQEELFRSAPSSTNTTHIGTVFGAVHTGAGDLNVQVTIDALLQRLDTALTAVGADPEKKKSVLEKAMAIVQDVGTDFAAKLAAEFMKPG